jgi:acyl transferase domain-containing protein/acyl carrier protein
VCRDTADAVAALGAQAPGRVLTSLIGAADVAPVFMFPGQGAQYVAMARDLYQCIPAFRTMVDECADRLIDAGVPDLRQIFDPAESQAELARQYLDTTAVVQPALFVAEYALARLLIQWGLHPQAMIGHSVGEYVAACLADVFSLEDALMLIAARGRLMQSLPEGAMLSVALAADDVGDLLGPSLSLAAVNGPALCVLSGSIDAVEAAERQLHAREARYQRLHTSHAFHSALMEPILEAFLECVQQMTLRPPQIPYLSNLTGTWISAAEATDPSYWTRHLRQTVRFADGMHKLLSHGGHFLIEVGPGHTLSSLARHIAGSQAPLATSTMRHPHDSESDVRTLLQAVGKLWLAGMPVDWSSVAAGQGRQRVALPTYPFERQRYHVPARHSDMGVEESSAAPHMAQELADWFYIPSWKQTLLLQPHAPKALADRPAYWLIFDQAEELNLQLVYYLAEAGQQSILIRPGTRLEQAGPNIYTIDPRSRDDYIGLFKLLRTLGKIPQHIVHTWGLTPDGRASGEPAIFPQAQERGYYSLLFLTHALEVTDIISSFSREHPLEIAVVANGLYGITSAELVAPEKAPVLGPCRVIPQELPNIRCRSIDIDTADLPARQIGTIVRHLVAECLAPSASMMVAYRGLQRWVASYEPIRLQASDSTGGKLRQRGVYLITGGLGKLGLLFAEYLARTVQARLVLIGRSGILDADAHKLRHLEALGAEVLTIRADVADESQMREVFAATAARFGVLHGVIHAAGITQGPSIYTPIGEIERAASEEQFRPKVYGLYVLEQLLREHTLDFCLLCSSNAAVLGGLGFCAYAAANLFMDSFAASCNRTSATPWLSINWDGWRLEEVTTHALFRPELEQVTITPSNGLEVLARVLAQVGVSQVVVSPTNLAARLQTWVERRSGPLSAAHDQHSLYVRPALQTDYLEPSNEIERRIVTIWQQLLGVNEIGVHDNFFDLGGHSLLATQIISRLQDAFHVKLSLRSLFETPTVAKLAEVIAELLSEQVDDEFLTLLEQTSTYDLIGMAHGSR